MDRREAHSSAESCVFVLVSFGILAFSVAKTIVESSPELSRLLSETTNAILLGLGLPYHR